MAKAQQLIDRFPAYDKDNDGKIDTQEFSDLMTELGIPYQYPGTVKKMFRKLNYNASEDQKETVNLQQTIEYFNSFENTPKHDIWKAKYNILQHAHNMKADLQGGGGQTAHAAPGAECHIQTYQDTPQDAKINILIGQAKPNYLSQIEIDIEKSQKSSKVKPFIKLVLTSSTPQRAKQLETVFKDNYATFLNLLAEDKQDWHEEMQNFHINSIVQGTTTTFFFTTVNEELASLIQLFSEQFELIFNAQLECKCHLKFEFQYDFQHFLTKPQSNFYDVFVKQSRLSLSARTLRLMSELKKFFKTDVMMLPDGLVERAFPLGLMHIQQFGADLEFDSFGNEQEYELQSKKQLQDLLSDVASFLGKLSEGGMTIKSLLQLLDGPIYLQAHVGQWRVKTHFRLHNINKIFLKSIETKQQSDAEYHNTFSVPPLTEAPSKQENFIQNLIKADQAANTHTQNLPKDLNEPAQQYADSSD